jgi:hypothetical protein
VKAWTDATVAAHWDAIERSGAELERCDGLHTGKLEALGYWWPAPELVRDSALRAALGRKG